MAKSTTIKPAHKSTAEYYKARETFAGHNVAFESAVRSAFQALLASTAGAHGWTAQGLSVLGFERKELNRQGRQGRQERRIVFSLAFLACLAV